MNHYLLSFPEIRILHAIMRLNIYIALFLEVAQNAEVTHAGFLYHKPHYTILLVFKNVMGRLVQLLISRD